MPLGSGFFRPRRRRGPKKPRDPRLGTSTNGAARTRAIGPYGPPPKRRNRNAVNDGTKVQVRQSQIMAEVAKAIKRKFRDGWRGMTPSGLVHKVLALCRSMKLRLGLRGLLRYFCGYRRDRARWTQGGWALARALCVVCSRLSDWRASRPLVGGIRAACSVASSYAAQRGQGSWVLPRRIVSACRDSIPNAMLPWQLQSRGRGKPGLARILSSKHHEVHPSNWGLLRQGLTPDTFRSYKVYKDLDPSLGLCVSITRRTSFEVYKVIDLLSENASPFKRLLGRFRPVSMIPDTERRAHKRFERWSKDRFAAQRAAVQQSRKAGTKGFRIGSKKR